MKRLENQAEGYYYINGEKITAKSNKVVAILNNSCDTCKIYCYQYSKIIYIRRYYC